MAEIETTYRGHLIRYGENSDTWYAHDLGFEASNQSLAKLKTQIDKMYLDLRKKAAVKAFEIRPGYMGQLPTCAEATVTEYLKSFSEKDYRTGGQTLTRHKVAVVALRRDNDRASRAEKELSDLMPNTPEAQAAYDEALRLYEVTKAAQKAADEAFKAIPRLSIDDIRELVRIKESEAA
ncbi:MULTISPECIES: hypothetical protein [unclassified Mesorhizobium]|uniref:hypothetical protein n=1 Tax=unclassified Mesorhizobium TaxID=325217 RepID=UPI0010934B71|nr:MULTISPECIES: hypothetical protein [unclassified Mesorhizobium]TGT90884.1 hypothetical protein EN804_05985 [Mesorhizobium sp. M8A.F.Ca.ET.161.01.1.1]TGV43836.1 hypothetical protein EN785_07560 [Mesorhizobium sp. M8A.F.Ca.ET.142.01.1.1]